jgi:dTDP-4-dehydrorhamnose reductase
MGSLAVLGSTGMIGSGVTRFLSKELHQLVEVNRVGISICSGNEVLKFDASKDSVETLISQIPKGTTILNFIGVIRHKIDETRSDSVLDAFKVNGKFPRNLAMAASKKDCRVIQVGTDCVFSGKTGAYSETSARDPIDIYGRSKLQGENSAENLMTLRVSVVGKEWKTHIELMDWVLKTNKNGTLNGYTNHFWNGVTSLHLAKVISGILSNNLFRWGTFHLVPQDKKSKFELITSIAKLGGRHDLRIRKYADLTLVDRSLVTEFPEFNRILWNAAGFNAIPTIDFMLEDYFAWHRG